MKTLLRILLTLGVIAAAFIGGLYVYKSCSLKGCSTSVLRVYADSPKVFAYTDVLTDLQKDESFDVSDYPVVSEDYSIKVKQIAESKQGELFIYAYQPSGAEKDLRATTVRISTGINNNAHWKDYPVKLVSSAVTLYKYLVEDFELKPDALRYYDISAIHRKYIEGVDDKPTDDNTVNEVVYEVAQLWTVCTVDGNVTYRMEQTETIQVTSKHVGSIRYLNGFKFCVGACDAHYVAFSTEYNIERLIDADLAFITKDVVYRNSLYGGASYTYGDPVNHNIMLSEVDTASTSADGLLAHKYTWKRIDSIKGFTDYLASEKVTLTDATKACLDGEQWVFNFYESKYSEVGYSGGVADYYTVVSDVTILRLKFEMDGDIYNLGVVDNKQAGDDKPDNIVNSGVKNWWDDLIAKIKAFFAKVKAFFAKVWDFIRQFWNWFLIGAVALIVIIVFGFVLKRIWGK